MTEDSTPDETAADEPTRVVAQGTFDILHPGHVHYLEEAAAAGDELHVIVARADNIAHKPDPVMPDAQRRDTVAALEAVDYARLGHPEDFSVPIEAIDPDVLVLGHDQHHDERDVSAMLAEWGIDCRVERASGLDPDGETLVSSSEIKARVRERHTVEPSR
ncbi:adenylyltransferase/cytidyltransferase family protein [Halopiger xanaduensis]|uniref:FAD synthase n=1 Tax=Halopiger xanaduensis (strain DSM 18323 / JCM 14033 / SH-6) TaxID=797210 RepID=F8DCJ8_HALXS|nr:adenylyltransferase/cytidyltransferase family protein [Halopiger xanaduensis]AEH36040.1 cytidyltransferase-related domain protein [Halopiger xanaduensis SH-6]